MPGPHLAEGPASSALTEHHAGVLAKRVGRLVAAQRARLQAPGILDVVPQHRLGDL